MQIEIKGYEEENLPEMIQIWNEIVEEGNAFPQDELLAIQTGEEFFASQTYSGVAVYTASQ